MHFAGTEYQTPLTKIINIKRQCFMPALPNKVSGASTQCQGYLLCSKMGKSTIIFSRFYQRARKTVQCSIFLEP